MLKQSFAGINHEELEILILIKSEFLKGEISAEEARKRIAAKYKSISPSEFAYTEQKLKEIGFTDEKVHEHMDELIGLLEGILQKNELRLPEGHPIYTYQQENHAVKKLLEQVDALKNREFNREEWKELTVKLYEYNTHLARKQNQLFSKLEEKGFDRPSKIMWSFDNKVKKALGRLKELALSAGAAEEIRRQYEEAKEALLDLMEKEESILYPTSIELITEEEFAVMRKSDDEIGYCLIAAPAPFERSTKQEDVGGKDLTEHSGKRQIAASKEEALNVRQGKLTLEQINLIFRHLPVDLSFVDENELVQFYSDTAHRIFPRSAGVIGRNVMNCHPRESLDAVREIIEAFRSGRQSKAEFWLEMGDRFIYITYIAVRNDEGEFKGVLEMMQDAAHIRSLQGQRRLLNWEKDEESRTKQEEKPQSFVKSANSYGISETSVIFDIVKKYPYIRELMPRLSPKYEKLLNPAAFNTIGKIATLEMIAQRGGLNVGDLIDKLCLKIKEEEGRQG